MKADLILRNIIVIGDIQPAGYDRYSLITGSVVTDEQILSPSVFSERGVNVITKDFNLLILPNQIALNAINPGSNVDIKEAFIKILNLPIFINPIGLGINFHWQLLDDWAENTTGISRELLYNDKVKIFSKFFDTQDAKFGAYASVDYLGGRLKLDIKPITIKKTKDDNYSLDSIEVLNFQYNFHFDINNDQDKAEMVKWLSDYDKFKNFSEEITFTYK